MFPTASSSVFARHPSTLAMPSLTAEQIVLSRKYRNANPSATSSAGRSPREGTVRGP
jgi:hypothetical protein